MSSYGSRYSRACSSSPRATSVSIVSAHTGSVGSLYSCREEPPRKVAQAATGRLQVVERELEAAEAHQAHDREATRASTDREKARHRSAEARASSTRPRSASTSALRRPSQPRACWYWVCSREPRAPRRRGRAPAASALRATRACPASRRPSPGCLRRPAPPPPPPAPRGSRERARSHPIASAAARARSAGSRRTRARASRRLLDLDTTLEQARSDLGCLTPRRYPPTRSSRRAMRGRPPARPSRAPPAHPRAPRARQSPRAGGCRLGTPGSAPIARRRPPPRPAPRPGAG